MDERPTNFDAETWEQLPDFLEQLPESIQLHIWGDAQLSYQESEAVELAQILSKRFSRIEYRKFPRRINYSYYPVIGVMLVDGKEVIDNGVRIIGLPAGFQMTSLITAIQSVSFRGMTSNPMSRIKLHSLDKSVSLELITSAEDEAGTVMAHRIFNMAVASSNVKSYLIMADDFPEAIVQYSVNLVPHLVINGRWHVEGIIEEDEILKTIAKSLS